MKQLWSPWRSEYIDKGVEEGVCVFCEALNKDPKEGLVLFKGSVSFVMMNRYPYNSGHLMISPVRHVARLDDLSIEESIDLFRLLRHSAASLTKVLKPDGFNVGMNIGKASGAGIDDHLHLHIVPRWSGDTNFMPVIGELKVVPQHIKSTYLKLKPIFERIS